MRSDAPSGVYLDVVSHSVEQTRRLGAHLGRLLGSGDLVLLEGDFGAGKTTFTQGIAEGLGIDARYVNSPTFTLINEYTDGREPLAHVDLYRLEGHEQVATLGLEDYFSSLGVTVIEWPGAASDWLPDEYLQVRLSDLGEFKRTLRFRASGEHYSTIIDRFRKEAYGA